MSATTWHVPDAQAFLATGEVPRRLATALVRALSSVGDEISERPKVAALGTLWAVATALYRLTCNNF